MLKWLGILVSVLLALLAAVGAYLLLGLDPNTYKPRLSKLAAEQGFTLQIDGDLSWQLWPELALSLADTRISSARPEIPSVQLTHVDLALAWKPLLHRQIEVRALNLVGAEVVLQNYGQAPATTAPLAGAARPGAGGNTDRENRGPGSGQESDAKTAPGFGLAIDRITVREARLTLPSSGTEPAPTLENIEFDIDGLNLVGEPFALSAEFNFAAVPSLGQGRASINGQLAYTAEKQALRVNNAGGALSLAERPEIALSFELDSALNAEGKQSITVPSFLLQSAGATARGKLAGIFGEVPNGSVELDIKASSLRKTLTAWGVTLPPTADSKVLGPLQVSLQTDADGDKIQLEQLAVSLDDSRLNASGQIALAPNKNLNLRLALDQLDIQRYLAPPTNGTASSNGKPASGESLFAPLLAPLAWLDGGEGLLALEAEQLHLEGLSLSDNKLKVRIADRRLRIEQLALRTLGGEVYANGKVNLANIRHPVMRFTGRVQDLSLKELTALSNGEFGVSGALSLKLSGRSAGVNAEQLLRNLKASGQLRVSEPVIESINIERSYCEIAALVEQVPVREDWPEGSRLRDLSARFSLREQKLSLQDYDTGLGNLSLRGSGLVDLDAATFNVLTLLRLNGDTTSAEGCRVKSRRIRDRDIPIRCKDSFAAAGAGSCGPDGDIVRQLLQQKVLEKIKQKSGLDKKEDDKSRAIKGLLEGLLGG